MWQWGWTRPGARASGTRGCPSYTRRFAARYSPRMQRGDAPLLIYCEPLLNPAMPIGGFIKASRRLPRLIFIRTDPVALACTSRSPVASHNVYDVLDMARATSTRTTSMDRPWSRPC
jgi:hypothetical protein